jgi:cytochrome P450
VVVINHCAHHNLGAWGPDHDIYDPTRWFDSRGLGKENWVIPFSVGHRACLGKSMAMTNILKVTTTLLSEYTFEMVDKNLVKLQFESVGVAEMKNSILCHVEKRE